LRGHTLDLELTLSGLPSPSWLAAFHETNRPPTPIIGVNTLVPPKIVDGKICWSIGDNDLVSAWAYLTSCVDRANAESPPLREHRHEAVSKPAVAPTADK
jgi:hypothetical protein